MYEYSEFSSSSTILKSTVPVPGTSSCQSQVVDRKFFVLHSQIYRSLVQYLVARRMYWSTVVLHSPLYCVLNSIVCTVLYN